MEELSTFQPQFSKREGGDSGTGEPWPKKRLPDGASEGARRELEEEGGGGVASADAVLDGGVKAEAQRGVRALAEPGRVDALPEGAHALLGRDNLNRAADAELGEAIDRLQAGLDHVDGVDEGHGDDRSATGAAHTLEQGSAALLGGGDYAGAEEVVLCDGHVESVEGKVLVRLLRRSANRARGWWEMGARVTGGVSQKMHAENRAS